MVLMEFRVVQFLNNFKIFMSLNVDVTQTIIVGSNGLHFKFPVMNTR